MPRSGLAAAIATDIDRGKQLANCFEPRHAIRATHEGKTVDLVICYRCSGMYVYIDDQRVVTAIGGTANSLFEKHYNDAEIFLQNTTSVVALSHFIGTWDTQTTLYRQGVSIGRPVGGQLVEMLDRRGWQILVHAIGDGGISMTLDAFERARKLNPAPVKAPRHRLEHIESISASDINRFAGLGVIASMQPYHANPNGNLFDVWAVNLGPVRASRAWVWKSIRDAGGQLAFGSDWPVVSLDPRLGMHTALTRQTLGGQPPQGFIPDQRLTLDVVLDTYTHGSAYAEFAEEEKGTLAVGKLADVIVWDQDLFSLPVDQVHNAKVLTTIFDGQVVYQLDK